MRMHDTNIHDIISKFTNSSKFDGNRERNERVLLFRLFAYINNNNNNNINNNNNNNYYYYYYYYYHYYFFIFKWGEQPNE